MPNGPYSFCRSRAHSSWPAASNPLSAPWPVIAKTRFPSVTGDGVDMLCLRWACPAEAPSGRFHRAAAVLRSRHHSETVSPSATFRKMRSPLTIGVEPLPVGSASFQARPSLADHFTGSPVSGLVPRSSGPRHCGQSAADSGAAAREPTQKASNGRSCVMGTSGALPLA